MILSWIINTLPYPIVKSRQRSISLKRRFNVNVFKSYDIVFVCRTAARAATQKENNYNERCDSCNLTDHCLLLVTDY